MYRDDFAEVLKKHAGEKWRPANGTEGIMFMEQFCYRCSEDDGEDKLCEICTNTMIYDTKDDEYPKEWQYGNDGQPICAAFKAQQVASLDSAIKPPSK